MRMLLIVPCVSFRGKPVNTTLRESALIVFVRICEEQHVRRLSDVHTAVRQDERRRQVHAVHEDLLAIRAPIAIRVLENDDAIVPGVPSGSTVLG